MQAAASSPTVEEARSWFPALAQGTALLENAGGSQLPDCVIDEMARFMREDYVQTGASYPASQRATQTVADARDFLDAFMGNTGSGAVVIGPSTTQLLAMLAQSLAPTLAPGDEVVVHVANHEANIGPWVRLEKLGVRVKWWPVDAETGASSLEVLQGLLDKRTKVVAFPHVSNLLGNVMDVPAVTRAAHAAGARVVVDGVAYAPHDRMRVSDWNVDFYVYSTYKVYGPHMAALYGKRELWEELTGPNHFFNQTVPQRFEAGSLSYEGLAGLLALRDYLRFLAGGEAETYDSAARRMRDWERPLANRLIGYLRTHPQVHLFGVDDVERVPTVSFVHRAKSSQDVSDAVCREGVAIRHGHMYAYRLCEALGLNVEDGVVRVSAVHYNTPEEVERLIEVLDRVL
ncbi:MAG: cysteine desulfurase-like protein [Fimbriimonadaceae bacterium]|nr:cysteine desulfurase-like protein [Fimbriimonadaceae bacterium]QYK55693.1 MAG: cysteine desulfurase-like protein [Fimbriimonadaceae bacterium]